MASIHSGSRNLGHDVANYYQALAHKTNPCNFNRDLSYLTGDDFADYVHDVKAVQKFARDNRAKWQKLFLTRWVASR